MKKIRVLLAFLLCGVVGLLPVLPTRAQSPLNGSDLSKVAGVFVANNFRQWQARIFAGSVAAASPATFQVTAVPIVLPDGRSIAPFWIGQHVTVGTGSLAETMQITALSNCSLGTAPGSCTVSGNTVNAHGQGDLITTETAGLEEAEFDAASHGGGEVVIDQAWHGNGGTNAMITAAVPFQNVTIVDYTSSAVQYWLPSQQNATQIATPAPLVAAATCSASTTVCSDATAVGTWTSTANYFCIAYVDVMGNEGTCSTTANFTTTLSKAVNVTAPAASTGVVGYTIYGGTSYAAATQVPITSSVCTPTTIETVTPACAVSNATYGQTGSNAQVAAITVTTSPLAINATTTSSTTDYVGNPGTSTVYKYGPSARAGLSGMLLSYSSFPVGAAAATTVPNVIGTIAVPPGLMNTVGKSLRICGYATEASAGSTATISNMQLWWDAAGSDTATGVPILVGTNPSTNTLVTANTDQFRFCYDLRTTVAGASATAGSIIQDDSVYMNQYTASSVATVPKFALGQGPAAVVSLNLAGGGGFTTRIHIVWLHTTGTDGAGVQLQRVTIQDIS